MSDRNVLLPALRSPIDSLLYNAVPLRVKGRVRAFIGGIMVPFGALIGGVLLYALASLQRMAADNDDWSIRDLVRRNSTRDSQEVCPRADQPAGAGRLLVPVLARGLTAERRGSCHVDRLKRRLEESKTDEFTIFMSKLISEVGGTEANFDPWADRPIGGECPCSRRNPRRAFGGRSAQRGDAPDLCRSPGRSGWACAAGGNRSAWSSCSAQIASSFRYSRSYMLRDPDTAVRIAGSV